MIQVTKQAISPQKVVDSLKTDVSGSVVVHLAILRPSSEGQKLVSIEYDMDKAAVEKEFSQIEGEIRAKWEVQDISLYRRAGKLILGETILAAAIAAPHRKEAFEACQYAVEQLRGMKSVRKREIYEQ